MTGDCIKCELKPVAARQLACVFLKRVTRHQQLPMIGGAIARGVTAGEAHAVPHQSRALPARQPARIVDRAPGQQLGQFGFVDTEPHLLAFNLDFSWISSLHCSGVLQLTNAPRSLAVTATRWHCSACCKARSERDDAGPAISAVNASRTPVSMHRHIGSI